MWKYPHKGLPFVGVASRNTEAAVGVGDRSTGAPAGTKDHSSGIGVAAVGDHSTDTEVVTERY